MLLGFRRNALNGSSSHFASSFKYGGTFRFAGLSTRIDLKAKLS
jgi:hypothetical protein